jgi:uncharacterized protein with ParB-like and HNH nuclease domain
MAQTYIKSDKVIFGNLLSSQIRYRVPIYQRSYSWDDDHTEQLWSDLMEVLDSGKVEYFLGPIVVVEKDADSKEIIDGQQRLVTLSILLSAIRDTLKEKGDVERSEHIDNLLGKKDFRTRKILPKITLNEFDNNFYENSILNNNNPLDLVGISKDRQLCPSNRSMACAYILFKNLISKAVDGMPNAIDFIVDLHDIIVKKICLIEIVVTDEADAYALFETLNDRGLDLSVADLLKNFLFGKAGTKIKDIQQIWSEINLTLGKQSITQFLRHYWISNESPTTEKQLYRRISEKYKNKETTPFINSLKDNVKIYAAFRQPDNEIWDEYGTPVKEHLRALRVFDVAQCFPLLLATYDKKDPRLFSKVLEMLVNISFRYTVICERRTSLLETSYGAVARGIRKGELRSGVKIFEELQSIYPTDTEFKNSFCEKKIIRDPKLARYILINIEKSMHTDITQQPNSNEREVTLEHILPENPNQDWSENFTAEEARDFAYRIGNLTLLPTEKNKKQGSKSFKDKCDNAYKGCGLKITEEILLHSAWNTCAIIDRQAKLADVAVNAWKIIF